MSALHPPDNSLPYRPIPHFSPPPPAPTRLCRACSHLPPRATPLSQPRTCFFWSSLRAFPQIQLASVYRELRGFRVQLGMVASRSRERAGASPRFSRDTRRSDQFQVPFAGYLKRHTYVGTANYILTYSTTCSLHSGKNLTYKIGIINTKLTSQRVLF